MTLSGFTTDIMLPAFDAMVLDLNTSLDLVQGTVAAFALFFGIAQFFYGPASDKFGRRPVIVTGMSIFIAGSALATFGPDITTVLLGRGLQGFGAGAAPVLARAILRDTHGGTALARAMALSMAIFAIGPIVAPLVGYVMVEAFGWRSTFACTGLFAMALLLFTIFRLRETNLNRNPHAVRPRQIWTAVKSVSSHRQSSYFLICGVLGYCALFTYISNAPRIYATAFGISGLGFAVFFALTGLGIVLGQVVNRALLPRFGILIMLRISSLILFLASGGVLVLAWLGLLQVWYFTVLMFFFNTSFLVVVSNTATLCLDPHPTIAGLASAFYGFTTNFGGAVFIILTVTFAGASPVYWAVTMTILTLFCAGTAWAARQSRLVFSDS
ncbi:MAG: multidrug effflux MFS transporter [Rhizobiaceae bacterium]